MAKDLICGMEVKENGPVETSTYKGKKYYFCSTVCKKKFDDAPEAYIKSEEGDEGEDDEGESLLKVEKETEPDRSPIAKSERIDIPLVGMSCASCASTIQRSLSALTGVETGKRQFCDFKSHCSLQASIDTGGRFYQVGAEKRL